MKKLQFTLAACVAVSSSLALAQPADTSPAATTPAATTPAAAHMGGDPNAHLGGQMASRGNAGPVTEASFVEKAAVGGMFEVQSSQLATTASQTAAIQTFAQQMISDHQKANQELMQLAASKNLKVPAALDQRHAKMLSDLAGKNGTEFDEAYGAAQVRAHNQAVALFQSAASSLTDPELKAFAAKTLPVLQHHQAMTKTLPGADKAGAGGKGKGKGNKNKENSSSNE